MGDNKAAADLIRALKDKGYNVQSHKGGRCKVTVEGETVFIPGPTQRTSGRAILNARATLRRVLGIDI